MSKHQNNIAIFPGSVPFSQEERKQWDRLGNVTWDDKKQLPVIDYLAFDPDGFGGFEGLQGRLKTVLAAATNLRGIAINTTAFGYLPWEIIRKRSISVSYVPEYSRESVAEHTLALMLNAAKQIFVSERDSLDGSFRMRQGFELAGKTLGVIGLGSIGSRVAELGRAIGMTVLGWDRSQKYLPGLEQVSLEKLLSTADVISLHLAENEATRGFLGSTELGLLKPGTIVINTADRQLVDEVEMAKALDSDTIDLYVLEAEDLESKPLGSRKNAILLQPYGWYTKESLERNKQMWFENVRAMVGGRPVRVVATEEQKP